VESFVTHKENTENLTSMGRSPVSSENSKVPLSSKTSNL
jgi:hypothetical protein